MRATTAVCVCVWLHSCVHVIKLTEGMILLVIPLQPPGRSYNEAPWADLWSVSIAITSLGCLPNWFRVSIDLVMRTMQIYLHQLLRFSVIK